MIYNIYVDKNKYVVDYATDDDTIVQKKLNFEMVIGDHCEEFMSNTRTIDNQPLKATTIDKFYDYNRISKAQKDSYGIINPINYCVAKYFPKEIKLLNPIFHVIDIEVYSPKEFPEPTEANYPINLISIVNYKTRKVYTLGTKQLENKLSIPSQVEFICHETEQHMLESLITIIETENIKCMTGWNVTFDISTITNRMFKLESKSFLIREWLEKNIIKKKDKNHLFKTIQVLDYLELYKKFKAIKLERYSLEFVSQFELGHGKMPITLSHAEMADKKWDEYVQYNIVDVINITKLEDKLRYIRQAFHMTNTMYCLPSTIYSPVNMWDSLLYNILYRKNIMIPPIKPTPKDKVKKLLGGFVGNPIVGFHEDLSVFDISSSYPHQIIQWNISPETYIEEDKLPEELKVLKKKLTPSIDEILGAKDDLFKSELKAILKTNKKERGDELSFTDSDMNLLIIKYNITRFSKNDINKFGFITNLLKKYNVTMTVNLSFYTKEFKGFIPIEIQKAFNERNEAKFLDGALGGAIKKIKDLLQIKEDEQKQLMSFEFVEDEEYEQEVEMI